MFNKMDGVKERLYGFLEHKKLKPAVFERNCGLSNGFCSKVGDNIKEGSLLLIHRTYPELNLDWLKTGEGEMEGLCIKPVTSAEINPDIERMLGIMRDLISMGDKNAEANKTNADANLINARTLERLVNIIEQKLMTD